MDEFVTALANPEAASASSAHFDTVAQVTDAGAGRRVQPFGNACGQIRVFVVAGTGRLAPTRLRARHVARGDRAVDESAIGCNTDNRPIWAVGVRMGNNSTDSGHAWNLHAKALLAQGERGPVAHVVAVGWDSVGADKSGGRIKRLLLLKGSRLKACTAAAGTTTGPRSTWPV